MTESIHSASGCDGLRGMDRQFAVVDHMRHVEPDKYGGTLGALVVHHYGSHGQFGACPGCRRYHDQR